MTSQNGIIVRIVLVAMLALVPITGSVAQDVRLNPFLPNSTEEERRLLAEKERLRQAIREMMPEIRTMLAPVFEGQRASLLAEVQSASAVVATASTDPVPAPDAVNGTATGDPSTIAGTKIPATAVFVACINGKAMYRDATGTKYFDEADAAAACSR